MLSSRFPQFLRRLYLVALLFVGALLPLKSFAGLSSKTAPAERPRPIEKSLHLIKTNRLLRATQHVPLFNINRVPLTWGSGTAKALARVSYKTASVSSLEVNILNDTDDGNCSASDCSLREAINKSKGLSGASIITFKTGLSGTVVLTSELPVLGTELTIKGPGANTLAVSGNNARRVFLINSKGVITLSGLTIRNGYYPGDGAGISNNGGLLSITNCIVSDNHAVFSNTPSSSSGGGILSLSGSLTVTNCVLSNNSAYNTGGGIFTDSNTLVQGTTFDSNSANGGGGIFSAGQLKVQTSTFMNNAGSANGGGIFTYVGGALTVMSSTFVGNTAHSSESGGAGGGAIYNDGGANATVVQNSTFSGNMADFGGALVISNNNGGNGSVDSCTFTGNSSSNVGVNKYGGGIWSNGTTVVQNSIVVGNSNADVYYETSDVFTSNGHNLIGNGNAAISFFLSSDKTGVKDAKLGPLSDNGGPTQTRALLAGSPAINTGLTSLSQDQRGVSRPSGTADDIGAFEVQDGVDTQKPSLLITTPTQSQTLPVTGLSITGSASDDVGVTQVYLKFGRNRNGTLQYWNGKVFTTTDSTLSAKLTPVGAKNTTWSYAISTALQAILDPGDYFVLAYARDSAKNQSFDVSCSFSLATINLSPSSVLVDPVSSTTASSTVRSLIVVYTDPNGNADITQAGILINTAANGGKALYASYDALNNRLQLFNDNATGVVGSAAPGERVVLSNGQGSLNCAATKVTRIGNNLTINWSWTPNGFFTGTKTIYGFVRDFQGAAEGFKKLGTWTIQVNPGNDPPINRSLTPATTNSAAGSARTFVATYADPEGVADINQARILIGDTAASSQGLYGVYYPATKQLYLFNDEGNKLIGGFAPGSANTITNSQGTLNCAATKVSMSGSTLIVTWSFTPKATFTGGKTAYLWVRDNAGLFDGFDPLAIWNISAPADVPTSPSASDSPSAPSASDS